MLGSKNHLVALFPIIMEPDGAPDGKRPGPVDGGPVSDGPAPAHANAVPTRSPAPQVRFSHKF